MNKKLKSEIKKEKKIKEKKKITKIQITRIVLLGCAVVFLILGVIFTCIKQPIDGSIYYTNTTLEEREKTWEKKYSELFKYYDEQYPASHYENQMETSSFCEFLYKYSYTSETSETKTLVFELYNNSQNSATIGAIYIENRENESLYYKVATTGQTFTSRSSTTYTVEVPSSFEIADYVIWARNVNYDGHNWTVLSVDSYQNELERTKTFTISAQVKNMIGERPTNESESTEPIPGYMQAIINARLTYAMMYIISGILIFVAIFIRERKFVPHRPFEFSGSYTPPPSQPKEVIIKEIHHEPKIKRVVCLYCGSRYKDNLDECPNCGSSKIKPEQKSE